MRLSRAIVAACGLLVVGLPGAGGRLAAGQSLTLLGPGSGAYGVSADGRAATGTLDSERAFVWTAEAGRIDFGPGSSRAYAISGDGTTVVGQGIDSPGNHAFRWRGSGPLQFLHVPSPSTSGRATSVSGDGSVVVGFGADSTGFTTSFRWTVSGGMQVINAASGADEAYGVSRDGGTIVGTGFFGGSLGGYVWTQAGGTQRLLSRDGVSNTTGLAVNFDGSIVLGQSQDGPTFWRNGVPTALSPLGGPLSGFLPRCLNDAGTIVGGDTLVSGGASVAVVWTQNRGVERLTTYLGTFGVAFPSGYSPSRVMGVSADGLTIVGWSDNGTVAQGFVATIPSPGTATLAAAAAALALRRRRGPSTCAREKSAGVDLVGSRAPLATPR